MSEINEFSEHQLMAAATAAFNDPRRIVSLPVHELETTSRTIHRDSRGFGTILSSQRPDWGHQNLKIRDVWASGFRGAGVKVAVLDTGVSRSHEDLVVTEGMDFSGSPIGWDDRQSHGTHCAGIIGARDNNVGVVGVAPECSIYAGKVLGDDGSGSIAAIASGIDWAVSRKVDVISMSLGGDGPISGMMRESIDRAISAGVIVIVAAGNSGPYPRTVGSPGNHTPCVTVGATDRRNRVARFSSRGPQLDVCAPGVDIVSCVPGSRYTAMSGTSMATPYVAGIAALFVNACKQVSVIPTQQLFESYARRTAKDLGATGFDNDTGCGLIQPGILISTFISEHTESQPQSPPVPSPPSPPPPTWPDPEEPDSPQPPVPQPPQPPVPQPPQPPTAGQRFTMVFSGVQLIPEQ